MSNPKNKSRFKSLDKIAASPLVVQIYDEGEDGIWVDLTIQNPFSGTTAIHEWTVANVISEFKSIQKRVAA